MTAITNILSHIPPLLHHLSDVLANNAVQTLVGLVVTREVSDVRAGN